MANDKNADIAGDALRAAWHEAGHAVIARELGIKIVRVSIIPDEIDNSDGHVRINHPAYFMNRVSRDNNSGRGRYAYRGRLEDYLTVLLAGEQAAQRALNSVDNVGPQQDYAITFLLAGRVCGEGKERDAFLNWLSVRASELLTQPRVWFAVETLARTLHERRKMSGRAVNDTIFESFAVWASSDDVEIDDLEIDETDVHYDIIL